jgi:hypothetical protein
MKKHTPSGCGLKPMAVQISRSGIILMLILLDLVNLNALVRNQVVDRSISICLWTKLGLFFMWVGASAPTHCENKETNHASGLKPGPTCKSGECVVFGLILIWTSLGFSPDALVLQGNPAIAPMMQNSPALRGKLSSFPPIFCPGQASFASGWMPPPVRIRTWPAPLRASFVRDEAG